MKTSRSNKLKGQLIKIFWITFVWILISLSQFFIGYNTVMDFDCDLGGVEPIFFFKGALLTGTLAGLIGGSSLVLIWEKWLRSKNYGIALFDMFWSYIIVYILVAVPTALYRQSFESGHSLFDPKLWKLIWTEFIELGTIQSFISWLIIILGTLIVLQVNDKYGPGIFRSFLLGKYFQPTREQRIFMFLDLRSSTTIAEKLGEERYFHFIKNVFKDVTPAILDTQGEIYQYVGDEIIISWKMDNGIKNANCIQCFFEIQAALLQKRNYYEENYDGIKPEFKAGLHYGYVMAGEIGVVKRDIAYSGDVLNTAARIQSKCNELGVNVLLSEYLLDKLLLKPNVFHPQKIGEMELRGKEQKVMLFTL